MKKALYTRIGGMLTAVVLMAAAAFTQVPGATVLDVGVQPAAVAINPVSNQAFVLNHGTQDVVVIDLAHRAILGRYTVGGVPSALAVNGKTDTVVVVSQNGEVTLIDQSAGKIAARVRVGKGPSRIAIDGERNVALVTNFNGSNLAVIDLAARKVISTIALKNGPLGIAVLEGKRRAIVTAQYDMEILQVDLEKKSVDKSLLAGRYLGDIAVNPVTGLAVVGNTSSGGVLSVYDPVKNVILSTLSVGAGPLSLAVYPRRNLAVVGEYMSGTVKLVDIGQNRVIQSIVVDKGPTGVAVAPESGITVVVSSLAGTATILDLEALLASVDAP